MRFTARGLPQLSTRALYPVMVEFECLGWLGRRTRDGRTLDESMIVSLPVPIIGAAGDQVGFLAELTVTVGGALYPSMSGLGYVSKRPTGGYPEVTVDPEGHEHQTTATPIDLADAAETGPGHVILRRWRLRGVQLSAEDRSPWDEPLPRMRAVPPSQQQARKWKP
jgi:hypothetical protein